MEVDYVIVGLGLAGVAMAECLDTHNKTFIVFDDESQHSSRTAAGAYNPVILKRFTPVWNGSEQIQRALPFYQNLEKKLGVTLDFPVLTKKVFKSIEDQNNWFTASDHPRLQHYLDAHLDRNSYAGIRADFGFGNVKNTGWIDTNLLLDHYQKYLKKKNRVFSQKFDYRKIQIKKDRVLYDDIITKKVIFCEGYGIKQNPYFKDLPLNGTKGEVIIIHAPDLKIDFQVKSSIFVLPLGNHHYKVGATFHWSDKTSTPTEEGKQELIEKLAKVITVPYQIVDHKAGVRPTVKDRRPLIGVHKEFKNLAILNGLGTRGVMIGPTVAKQLFEFLEFETPLDPEIDINRF